MTAPTESPLRDPAFWNQPLEDRMREFAEIREQGAFVPVEFDNPMTMNWRSWSSATGRSFGAG